MTEAQRKRFFFPVWHDTCRRIGWKMDGSRLVMTHPNGANVHQNKVIAAATARAAAQHRAPVLDDLRHGCYIVALGHDRDTLKMSNRDVDAVTSLFKLLVSEANIKASMDLADPDRGERERLVKKIHSLKIPDAMIETICKRSFAPVYTGWFEDLPLVNLRALVGILSEIKERKSTPHPGPLPIRSADSANAERETSLQLL